MTLSSVAIASKWDEPEKIKVLIVSKVKRKVPFMYLQRRYTEQQIAVLNKVVRIRGKIKTFKFSTAFLKACRSHRVAPKYMIARIERPRIRHTLVVEWAFINNEIEKQTKQLKKLRAPYRTLLRATCQFLSFFDKIRFYRYLAMIEEKTSIKIHN